MAENTVATNNSTAVAEQGQTTPQTRDEERYLVPPVDIYETDQGLHVVADLPGVARDDLKIRVEKGVLTIEGRTRQTSVGDALRNEYRLHNFFRQFTLSDEVDVERIRAELKHGVLHVDLPRVAERQPREISVNVN